MLSSTHPSSCLRAVKMTTTTLCLSATKVPKKTQTNQTAFESKLESIERRVTINTTVTTELSRATEFNSHFIKNQQVVIDTLQKSLGELSRDNVNMSSTLSVQSEL